MASGVDCHSKAVAAGHRSRRSRRSAFSIDRLRKMFGFGSKMLAAGLLSAFFNNLITLVTGKVYSPLEVGYYDVARRYQEYPANNLTTIFSRVSFPAFAREQDNILRLRQLFVKTLRVSSALVFPVMGLLCGVAHPLFESLLGAKWLPSVPLFQVLCVVGLFQPISAINLNYLLAQWKSGHFLVLEIVKIACGAERTGHLSPWSILDGRWLGSRLRTVFLCE